MSSIEFNYDENPPANISWGRTALNSDFWRDSGFDGQRANYYLGIIDSGLRATHQQFTAPGAGALGFLCDCRYGNSFCDPGTNMNFNTADPYWGHGTGGASIILSGLSSWGTGYTGVSRIAVDSFNVFGNVPPSDTGSTIAAVTTAFQRAVAVGDGIVWSPVQRPELFNGLVARAADDAFDGGTAVIAAVGNAVSVSAPASPGNAHKALGIGAYVAQTGAVAYQVDDFTSDNRWKPEVRGPSSVHAASSTIGAVYGGTPSNTGWVSDYNGTSGGSAFMAGAAVILRDAFDTWGAGTAPGQIYSGLLALGNVAYPFSATEGTGNARLPGCSTWWVGQRTFTTSTGQSVSMTMPSGRRNMRAAIWWPERYNDTHARVSMKVIQGASTLKASADHFGNVFNFDTVPGNLGAGAWRLDIDPGPATLPHSPLVVSFTVVTECQ